MNKDSDRSDPVLHARGVTKHFLTPAGKVQVLHEVTLAVREGEFVAVTGPSGSGKTTFLNLAALLDRPSTGQLFMGGQDVCTATELDLCRLRSRKIGMVFQQFCLLPNRTVLENVMFRFRYLDCCRADALQAAREAIDLVGLASVCTQPARLLSGGEMQRAAIARAICVPPRLLLVDEPTGNLDQGSANQVMGVFDQLNTSGITILMVTHNESLLGHCSRCIGCEDGRIIADGGG